MMRDGERDAVSLFLSLYCFTIQPWVLFLKVEHEPVRVCLSVDIFSRAAELLFCGRKSALLLAVYTMEP